MKINHLLSRVLLSVGLAIILGGCQAEKAVEVQAPNRAELTQKLAELRSSTNMPPEIKASAIQSLETQLKAAK